MGRSIKGNKNLANSGNPLPRLDWIDSELSPERTNSERKKEDRLPQAISLVSIKKVILKIKNICNNSFFYFLKSFRKLPNPRGNLSILDYI